MTSWRGDPPFRGFLSLWLSVAGEWPVTAEFSHTVCPVLTRARVCQGQDPSQGKENCSLAAYVRR